MRLSLAEKETHLWWDMQDRTWRASTEVPAHQRRLQKLGWKLDKSAGEWVGGPRSVTLRASMQQPKKLTEDQREKRRAQGKALAALRTHPPRRGSKLPGPCPDAVDVVGKQKRPGPKPKPNRHASSSGTS